MHHPTDRIAHTTAFVTPVVEHWLEREITQWVHPMKDRSDDPSHHERTLLPWSYISLLCDTNRAPSDDSITNTDRALSDIIYQILIDKSDDSITDTDTIRALSDDSITDTDRAVWQIASRILIEVMHIQLIFRIECLNILSYWSKLRQKEWRNAKLSL